MGKQFRSCDLNQAYLLPPSPQDWLPEGHLALFVADVVEALDLSAIYAKYEAGDGRGQAAYDPRMMVRVLICGDCRGVASSRRVERREPGTRSRPRQGAGGQEHAELAGVDGGGEGGRALQEDRAGFRRRRLAVGIASYPDAQRAPKADHPGPGQHGRPAAREARRAILSWQLWALLKPPVVHLLWGAPAVRATAPGEYRWRGGKRGGTRPPGEEVAAGVAGGAHYRARRFGFLPGRTDGLVRGKPGAFRLKFGQE